MTGKGLRRLLLLILSISIIISSTVVPIHYRTNFYLESLDEIITTAILIEKDDDFKKNGFKGSGTIEDPYTLANKRINTLKKCAIAIIKTKAYFRIINCSISSKNLGIYIYSVAEGTCEISNNYISLKNLLRYVTSYYCIRIQNATSAIITNNFCVSIHKNYFYKKGLAVSYSSNSIIKNNTFTNFASSLAIYQSNNIAISYNTFLDCHFSNSIRDSNNISFSFNNISTNRNSGFSFTNCNSITINNNTIIGDGDGFYAYRCSLLIFVYNYFHTKLCIYLHMTTNSLIHHNNFILYEEYYLDLNSQAKDDNQTNLWYDILTFQGNFWSDLVWGDGIEYPIDGPANNTDPYPLENPVSI